MNRQQADLLIAEFGKHAGVPDLALDESGVCSLSIEGGAVTISVAFDSETGVASMESALDRVPLTPQRLKRALAANFCWIEGGGATFGLDSLGNRLVLRRHFMAADLDVARLTGAVQALVGHTLAFTKMLGELKPDERPAARGAHRPTGAFVRA